MFKKLAFVFVLFTVLSLPAIANAQAGCKNGKFVGSYTSATPDVDIFGDGTVVRTFIFQLNLHSDGNVYQTWTGLPEHMINAGTGSANVGSWTCRRDGMLVVQFISGTYLPSAISPNAPNPDITLLRHVRTTLLFSVEDQDTLKRVQSRSRRYGPNEDPTDPNGGILGGLFIGDRIYNRVIASDADLLLP